MNTLQTFDYNLLRNCEYVIGVDEVGRGSLAGPVAAAACLVGRDFFASQQVVLLSAEFKDSKKLTPKMRSKLMQRVEDLRADGYLDYAVGSSSVKEIATHNILGATRLAMQRALDALLGQTKLGAFTNEPQVLGHDFISFGDQRCLVQIDGPPLKAFPYPHRSVVKGDGQSLSIAIASVVAKVHRDAYMQDLDRQFPVYGFAQHKGYGTEQHRFAVKAHGAISEHRHLFLRKLYS